jgi:hypothetical protein
MRGRGVLLVAVVMAAEGRGLRADPEADFRAAYARHEDALTRQYVHNCRIKVEGTGYDYAEPTGRPGARGVDTIVSRSDAFRWNAVVTPVDGAEPKTLGAMFYGDEVYDLLRAGERYTVRGHWPAATHGNKVEEVVKGCYLFLPLSFAGQGRLVKHFETWDRQRERGHPYQVRSTGPTTRGGRPVVGITGRNEFGITTTSYHDPANHYAFVAFDTDGSLDIKTRQKRNVRTAGELTYMDGPEGFPIPSEYRQWWVLPDGRRVPIEETRFTEYERYTPTDDDFDLEKQFGVKPLPKGQKFDASYPVGGRRGWWLWALAGGLAVVTAGLVWYARRRRAATTG